jgi:hypothetical protein
VVITSSVTNWSSSDTSVLTVNSEGVITAVNAGAANISATLNGMVGTSASITVPTSGPRITHQPQSSESLLAGETFTDSMGVVGNPPLVCRWFFNNGANPVSTTAIPALTISNVQPANAGSYTCLISNQYGSILSDALNLTVVSPNTYQKSLLSLGPLAYWPLSETSGTTAYDLAGDYDGTYIGGFTLAQSGPTSAIFGPSSRSTLFDGVSGYVDIPEGPFDITGAITTVAWIDVVSTPNFAGLFGHGDASWRMSINSSGQPGANDGSSASGDATSPVGIDDGNWHMVAFVYTGVSGGNNGSLYLDGSLVANNSVTTPPVGDGLDVWIGGSPDYGTSRLLNARIADVAFFNRALSASQIQDLYTGTYAAPVSLGVTREGSSIVLNWASGLLLQAPTVLGPWTTNGAAVSPYSVPAAPGNQFFKVLVTQ